MTEMDHTHSEAVIPSPINKQGPLKQHLKWVIPAVLAIILLLSIARYLLHVRALHAPYIPTAIVVSPCSEPSPTVHRIISDFGTRFDVPETAFTVHSSSRDSPPGTLSVVRLTDSDAKIVVWRNDEMFWDLIKPWPVFSEHLAERSIFTTNGRLVGTDHWGCLKTGERWRYVIFSRGDTVEYPPTSPKEARLLDQVFSSACF
jgi:hypothetical protein